MGKRHKIFESGDYPQGPYSVDRVKSIFSKAKDKVMGVFMHSSKTKGKEVQLADFSKVDIVEKDGKVEVFADIEFNDIGKMMHDKGMFSGVSVEVPNDNLTKIALLPIGINPAVAGAEFQEENTFYFEFEEKEGGKEVTIEEIIAFLKGASAGDKVTIMTAIVGTLTEAETRTFRALAFEFSDKTGVTTQDLADHRGEKIEFQEEVKPKSETEIRADLEAEFAARETKKVAIAGIMEANKTKILPWIKDAVEFALIASYDEKDNVEFEEAGEKKEMRRFDLIKSKLEKAKTVIDLEEFADINPNEFEEKNIGEKLADTLPEQKESNFFR